MKIDEQIRGKVNLRYLPSEACAIDVQVKAQRACDQDIEGG